MTHTKEPWVVDQDGDRIGNAEGADVLWGCGCCGSPNLGAEDARRIVACVNACTGIDDDTLEAGAIVETSKLYAADKAREQLEQQREELVTALIEIRDWVDRWTTPGHPVSTFADKALAKVGAGNTATKGHNAEVTGA